MVNEIGTMNDFNSLGLDNHTVTQILKYTYLYLLIRFKLEFRQVTIITHIDFDGAVSAATLLQRYPYARVYVATPSNLHKVLYVVKSQRASDFPQAIFILDLGITLGYQSRVLRAIQTLRKENLVEVMWMDHHENADSENLAKYMRVHLDPQCPHTAHLVQKWLHNTDGMDEAEFSKINCLLSILEHATTPFLRYWRVVLKEAIKSRQRETLVTVIQTLARFKRNRLTNLLYAKALHRRSLGTLSIPEVIQTRQGYRFLLFVLQDGVELYPQVRSFLLDQHLDFVIARFEDGSLSAYKNKGSSVNLRPLFQLVDGKGHEYAFHFAPQIRITDEFYRPMPLPDLITKVQEIL